MRRHQDSVRGFLVVLGCPARLLDDLVQDTFLSLFASKFEDRGETSTAAFLRTVARHLFLKALQREHRQPALADAALVEGAWIEFERDDGGQTYLAALRECLRSIRGKTSRILDLRYRERLRQAAIAGQLGMSESGVKSVLVRARKRLRACIERRLPR